MGSNFVSCSLEYADGLLTDEFLSSTVNCRTHQARIAAFFDIDRTIIEVNSGRMWLVKQLRSRSMRKREALRFLGWLVLYYLGKIDFDAAILKSMERYRGISAAQLEQEVAEWFQCAIFPRICRQARAQIAEHRAQGHEIVLLTSATRLSSRTLQVELGADHLLCTELEVSDDGVLTGGVVFPTCYGQGKVWWAEKLALSLGLELEHCFFYTDSISDLPMLERVGKPKVINPDVRLRRIAKQRGWPIENWSAS